jgi:hypothetical protein
MAHDCPICGCQCHCNGDIDDINFGEAGGYDCSCCDEEEIDEDELNKCDWCGGCYGTHFSDCDKPK